MNITHVMADGTTRESIEGVLITADDFYRVAQGIIDKRKGGRGFEERKKADLRATEIA